MTPDPKVFPWQSPYCSMDCNPVALIDPWGDETIDEVTVTAKNKGPKPKAKGPGQVTSSEPSTIDASALVTMNNNIDNKLNYTKKVLSNMYIDAPYEFDYDPFYDEGEVLPMSIPISGYNFDLSLGYKKLGVGAGVIQIKGDIPTLFPALEGDESQ